MGLKVKEFIDKRENILNYQDYTKHTGPRLHYLAEAMRKTAQKLRNNGEEDVERARDFEQMSEAFDVLGSSWRYNYTNGEVGKSLGEVDKLLGFTMLNNFKNYSLLQETINENPEMEETLAPEDRNKHLTEHLSDISDFFKLGMKPQLEGKRRKEEEELKNAELAEQKRREEEQRKAALEEKQRKRAALRDEKGPFAVPDDIDNRDVSARFLQSARTGGPEFKAVQDLSDQIDQAFRARETFEAEELTKRYDALDREFPKDAPDEVRRNAVMRAARLKPAAQLEPTIRGYYEDGSFEKRLNETREKLGEGATRDDAVYRLYADMQTEQSRNAARRKQYSTEKVTETRWNIRHEMGQKKLDDLKQNDPDEYAKKYAEKRFDIIARRMKGTLMGVGDNYKVDVLHRLYQKEGGRLDMDLLQEQRDGKIVDPHGSLFRKKVGAMIDNALYDRKQWNDVKQIYNDFNAGPETRRRFLQELYVQQAVQKKIEDEVTAKGGNAKYTELDKRRPELREQLMEDAKKQFEADLEQERLNGAADPLNELFRKKVPPVVNEAQADTEARALLNTVCKQTGYPMDYLMETDPARKPEGISHMDYMLMKMDRELTAEDVDRELLDDLGSEVPNAEVEEQLDGRLPLAEDAERDGYNWALTQLRAVEKEKVFAESEEKFPELQGEAGQELKALQNSTKAFLDDCLKTLPEQTAPIAPEQNVGEFDNNANQREAEISDLEAEEIERQLQAAYNPSPEEAESGRAEAEAVRRELEERENRRRAQQEYDEAQRQQRDAIFIGAMRDQSEKDIYEKLTREERKAYDKLDYDKLSEQEKAAYGAEYYKKLSKEGKESWDKYDLAQRREHNRRTYNERCLNAKQAFREKFIETEINLYNRLSTEEKEEYVALPNAEKGQYRIKFNKKEQKRVANEAKERELAAQAAAKRAEEEKRRIEQSEQYRERQQLGVQLVAATGSMEKLQQDLLSFRGNAPEGVKNAISALDVAWAKMDFDAGKAYREGLGVEPEKKPEEKKREENKIELPADELDESMLSEDGGEQMDYSFVDNDVLTEYQPRPEQQKVEEQEEQKVEEQAQEPEVEEQPKAEEQPQEEQGRKRYFFEPEDAALNPFVNAADVMDFNLDENDMDPLLLEEGAHDPLYEKASGYISEEWRKLNVEKGMTEEEKKEHLANIIAANELWNEAEQQQNPAVFNDAQLRERSSDILDSAAFRRAMRNGTDGFFEKGRNNEQLLLSEYETAKKDPSTAVEDALTGEIKKNWRTLRTDTQMSEDKKQQKLAEILAMRRQLKHINETHEPEPYDENRLWRDANEIRSSHAFTNLMAKGSANYTAWGNGRDLLYKDYDKHVRRMQRYDRTPEQQKKMSSRLAPVVDALERTETGYFIPGVARGDKMNSEKYNDALFAISDVKQTGYKMSVDQRYNATRTVMKYLDGKETVRVRAFGRERWNNCMTFLKYTMPPEEFEAYCDKINQKRGVANKPNHRNYVAPESFGPTNFQEAYDEVMERMQDGTATKRDYASALALQAMDPSQPVDRQLLVRATNAIVRDEAFQKLAKETPDTLDRFVKAQKPGVPGQMTYRDLAEDPELFNLHTEMKEEVERGADLLKQKYDKELLKFKEYKDNITLKDGEGEVLEQNTNLDLGKEDEELVFQPGGIGFDA